AGVKTVLTVGTPSWLASSTMRSNSRVCSSGKPPEPAPGWCSGLAQACLQRGGKCLPRLLRTSGHGEVQRERSVRPACPLVHVDVVIAGVIRAVCGVEAHASGFGGDFPAQDDVEHVASVIRGKVERQELQASPC